MGLIVNPNGVKQVVTITVDHSTDPPTVNCQVSGPTMSMLWLCKILANIVSTGINNIPETGAVPNLPEQPAPLEKPV